MFRYEWGKLLTLTTFEIEMHSLYPLVSYWSHTRIYSPRVFIVLFWFYHSSISFIYSHTLEIKKLFYFPSVKNNMTGSVVNYIAARS
jgi:hypothetical protein